jgi:uncharacterized protein (DUF2147 family)
VCDKCTDDRKDKPVLGMTIIDRRQEERRRSLGTAATILDPNNGKSYRCA